MLPKKHRISFEKFRSYAKSPPVKIKTRHLLVLIQKAKVSQSTQFSFVVPKKLDKRATRRNQTKRLLSNVVFELSPILNPGFLVALMASAIITNEQYKEVFLEVDNVLKKFNISHA